MKTTYHDEGMAKAHAAKVPGARIVATCLPLRSGYMPAWEVHLPRNTKVEGCPGCTEETFRPPHFASPACKSGGHNHCSCDACF